MGKQNNSEHTIQSMTPEPYETLVKKKAGYRKILTDTVNNITSKDAQILRVKQGIVEK